MNIPIYSFNHTDGNLLFPLLFLPSVIFPFHFLVVLFIYLFGIKGFAVVVVFVLGV
jgi:hypothetical protein